MGSFREYVHSRIFADSLFTLKYAIESIAISSSDVRGLISGHHTAVSYTHLDVYKRQTLGYAGAPGTRASAVRGGDVYKRQLQNNV